MDDAMLDLMADHGELRRRLDSYAEARLTPDLAASSRMRARVLAVAHRQSSVVRADATLALVADPDEATTSTAARSRSSGRARTVRRGATLLVAAALAAGAMSGVALAAQPGGGLYGARVWAETLTLPASPRERAVAELARLDERLAEITAATARGDDAAAEAALAAYQAILESAAASALLSDDAIAMLTIEEGAKHNITVLSSLVAILPDRASDAVDQALQRAIDRSTETVEGIGNDTAPNGGGNGNGPGENDAGGNGVGPAATPDPAATPKPTKEPKPTATPKPTKSPTPTAVTAPEPTAPEPTTHVPPARPTPRPTPDPPGDGGGGGGGNPGSGGNDAGEQSRPTPRGQGD